MSDANTHLWMSLELDPGTAGYFGLPERVYVPADAATPFLTGHDRQVTLEGLARALAAAAPHAPEQAGRFEVMRFLRRWPRYASLGRFLRVGNIAFARAAARALLEEDPGDPPALGALAVLAAREGAWDKARELLARALDEAPSHAPTRLQHALALAAGGDREAALLELDPLTRHPRVQSAARLWRHEIASAPADALPARVGRGVIAFQALADDESADETWKALCEAFPDNPEALLAAAASVRARDAREAERLLRRALEAQPDHAAALSLLVRLLLEEERTEEALAALDASPPEAGCDPAVQAAAAAAFERAGRTDDALAGYRSVFDHPLAKVPEHALLAAGDGLTRLFPAAEAHRAFEDAREARPGDPVPHLLLAELDEAEQGAEAAERRLRQAVRACGPLPALQYALGDLLRRGGRRVEAEGLFRVLVRRHPRSPWGYRGMGDLVTREDPRRAFVYYATALELDPWTPIPAFVPLRTALLERLREERPPS